LGAYQTYANANAASQQTSITSINANVTAANIAIATLSANVGAYETWANAAIASTNANVTAANAAIASTNANLGAFETYANAAFGPSSPSSYANANVSAYLASGTLTTNIITTANVSGNYILGNGSQLTGIASTYGNANVAAYLASNTDPTISTLNANAAVQAVALNTLNANVTAANVNIATLFGNAATQAGQINTINANLGAFQTYANATFGTSNYGNANVTTLLANFGSNSISTTGNISAGNVVSVGLATFSSVRIGGNLNYAESANLTIVEDKDGFADIIAQNQNAGGNASMNIVLVNNDPGNVYMALGVNSSTFTPLYNTLFEIPDAGYVSHSATQVVGPQSAESGNSNTFFTYNSGSYALELNANGAIGWGASYNGNLTQGNFGNVGQVLTSAGANSPPTWNNFSNIANGTSNVNIATANGNVTIVANASSTWNFSTSGNLTAPGNISAAGNITGNNASITNLTATGSLATTGTATAGNIITTSGLYWANGVSYASTVTGTYGNTQVAAYIPIDPTFTGYTTFANANAASQTTSINTISANLGAFQTYANVTFSTVANAATQATQINSLATGANANTASYLTTASISVANIASTGGYFWANGVAYSTGGAASSFSGNLAGNILYDSVNLRTFANAFPLSTPDATIPNNTYSAYMVYQPVYTNGQVQQPPLAANTTAGNTIVNTSGQVIGLSQSSNITLATGGTTQNRNTVGTMLNMIVQGNTSMANQDRVRGASTFLDVNLRGGNWGTMSSVSQNAVTLAGTAGLVNINGGGQASAAIGAVNGVLVAPLAGSTANVQYATAMMVNMALVTINGNASVPARANVVYARGIAPNFSGFSNTATIQNAVMSHTYSGWAGTNITSGSTTGAWAAYAVLNEDASTVIQTNGNIVMTGSSNLIMNSANNTFVATTGNVKLGAYQEAVGVFPGTSGTLTINTGTSTIKSYTLTGNITINNNNFTPSAAGTSLTLILQQDATGNRTLTSNILFAGGSKTLSTAPNAIDVLALFTPDGTTYYGSLVKGYS
jgi:hypothetical protein